MHKYLHQIKLTLKALRIVLHTRTRTFVESVRDEVHKARWEAHREFLNQPLVIRTQNSTYHFSKAGPNGERTLLRDGDTDEKVMKEVVLDRAVIGSSFVAKDVRDPRHELVSTTIRSIKPDPYAKN